MNRASNKTKQLGTKIVNKLSSDAMFVTAASQRNVENAVD